MRFISVFNPIEPQTIARSFSALKSKIPRSAKSAPFSNNVVIRPTVAEGLAGGGGIIDQLGLGLFTHQNIIFRFFDQLLTKFEFSQIAAAVGQNDLFEPFIGLRLAQKRGKGGNPRAG